MTEESLYQAALQLPGVARVALADRILASVDDGQTPVSDEWMAEIRRRVEAMGRGEARTVDADTVFRKLDERLGP
jgi:putative addiction module component (TIGR02574 family)